MKLPGELAVKLFERLPQALDGIVAQQQQEQYFR